MDRKQFEEWFKTTLSYAIFEDSNVWKVDLYAFNEPTNSYLHSSVQAAFESWQHQQAKVDKAEANTLSVLETAEQLVQQVKELIREKADLQKRVEWLEDRLKATDTLSKMRAAVIGSFNTQAFNARTRRKMMILKKAEQMLNGGEA
ncbi:hypothetical protein [Acinetobacter calcoaceticus]|uniref:hypothetical protein n=1 Tax=Acinetobacter calcoaceticus TaxID=471 RepID=UPI0018DD3A4C|nr:hypothetical protein [Acinetobacter calcoaceticus]